MIVQRRARPSIDCVTVVRGYSERRGEQTGPGVIFPLPGRPAQFLEVYLEQPYRVSVDGGSFAPAPDAVLVGPSSRHTTRLWMQGLVSTFHIAFQPSGFHRLFGLSMSGLADRAAATIDLDLPPLDDLVALIRARRSFEARVSSVETWLRRRLADARSADAMDRAARLLRRARGAPDVGWAAERAGVSNRHFQRLFVERVGLSPKLYCRSVRFEAVMDARDAEPRSSWTELAHRFGYFDQAHLLRDAHAFTGVSASRFQPQVQALSDPS